MAILSEKALKHKREYNKKRTQKLLKTFSATLKKEEYYEITDYLKTIGMNKVEFIKWAYDKIRED